MVKFNYEGKDYELGFNRKTAVALQRQGFDPDKIDAQSLIMIPMLVRASFKMNHRSVRDEKIDEIYEKLDRKSDLTKELLRDYWLTCTTLFNDSENESDESENSDFTDWSIE